VKALRDMTEPELKKLFRTVAERVKWTLPKGTLFVVLAMEEASGPGISQYVSNCDRGTMAALLRETADRFDRNDVVARVEEPPPPTALPQVLAAQRVLERLARAATDAAVAMREMATLPAAGDVDEAMDRPQTRAVTVTLNRVHSAIMAFGGLRREIGGDEDGGPL